MIVTIAPAMQDHTAALSVFEKTQSAKLILSPVCKAYGRMLLLQGLFQADYHPGNILVMKGDYSADASANVSTVSQACLGLCCTVSACIFVGKAAVLGCCFQAAVKLMNVDSNQIGRFLQ